MHAFTVMFLAALAVSTALRLWLDARHIAHVGAHKASVPQQFSDSIPLEAHRKAAEYTAERTRLGMGETLVGAAVVLAFTLGGGLQALSDVLARWLDAGGYGHGVALMASVAVISSLIDLPFSAYRTFAVEARHGFNRMTARLFVVDLAKGAAVAAALGIPLAFCVLWLMQHMGALWWLYVWATWMAFNLVMLVVYPAFIAPWFNRFSPLEDAELKARIETLLQRCGFRSKGLFVMDGSKRSTHGNAYFTGFGAGKRIVMFDTLLSRLRPAEVEAVLAHELGHYARRHIAKRVALLGAASLALLALLGWISAQPWFYQALGVRTPGTAMALLLFFMVLPSFTFLLQPLASLYSRRHEYEADAYAARHADGGELAGALVKLYRDNASTLTPDPLHSAFYDSHPPALARIARLRAPARREGGSR